jgi:hypothetical protein
MVNQFARQIIEAARDHRDHAADLVHQLEAHASFLGLDQTADTGRLVLARRSLELLEALTAEAGKGAAGSKKTVEALASFDLGETSADRYGTSIKKARAVAEAVASAPWSTLELAAGLGPEGEALLDSLRNVARDDQRTADLRDALARTQREVVALIKRTQTVATPPPMPVAPQPSTADGQSLDTSTSDPRIPYTPQETPSPGSGTTARKSGGRRTTAARAVTDLQAELSDLAARHPEATIEITWRVVE